MVVKLTLHMGKLRLWVSAPTIQPWQQRARVTCAGHYPEHLDCVHTAVVEGRVTPRALCGVGRGREGWAGPMVFRLYNSGVW